MDGVIADFEKGFLDTWVKKHPSRRYIPLAQRTTPYPRDQYPKKFRRDVEAVYTAKGFYSNLSPISGSQKALEEMTRRGAQVYLCTSPLSDNPHCASEKLLWVQRHFGKDVKKRTIITKDKTLIKADYLIDDAPEVKGIEKPEWEHIVYAQPYNQESPHRKLTWDNWREVLEI